MCSPGNTPAVPLCRCVFSLRYSRLGCRTNNTPCPAPPPQVYYSMTNTVPCNNGSPRHTASRRNTSPLIISKSTTKYPCSLVTSLFRNHNADYSLPFYNAKHVCGEYKKCSQNALGYIDSPFSLLWNSSTRQHTCDCVGLIRLGGDLGRFELMNVCKCYQTVPREASGESP